MALADFLGLSDTGALIPQARPNGAPYQFDLPAQQQALQTAVQPHQPSKFRNFLGAIGDALLVAHGQQPLYRQRLEQQREQGALQGFLTNPDQAIAQLMQVDAPSAINLYKAVHPASEIPDTAKLYEYRQKLPPEQRGDFDKVMQTLHPGLVAPITLGPNDTYESGGAAPAAGDVTATGPNGEKIRLNPQTGQWEPIGGQTGAPSGGFPVSGHNNPGALRVPGSMKFQSFSSPQEGIQAQQALLGRYMGRGLRDVSSIVERYAPRKSRGGDNSDASVNNYIGYVSRRLGVNPHDTLADAMLPQLAEAMREFETGRRAD